MPTMTLIGSYKVATSGLTFIQFGSLPTNYFDLQVRAFLKTTGTQTNGYSAFKTYFNGDFTDGNYGRVYLELYPSGTLNGAGESATANGYIPNSYTSNTANAFGHYDCYISNYRGSINKPFRFSTTQPAFGGTYSGFYDQNQAMWFNTAAITSVRFVAENPYAIGSQIELYGIEQFGTTGSGTSTVTTG